MSNAVPEKSIDDSSPRHMQASSANICSKLYTVAQQRNHLPVLLTVCQSDTVFQSLQKCSNVKLTVGLALQGQRSD